MPDSSAGNSESADEEIFAYIRYVHYNRFKMSNSVRRIHQHWPPAGVLYRMTDVASIIAGLAIASLQAQAQWTTAEHNVLAGFSAIVLYYFVAELGGMYRSWRGVSAQREIISLLFVWICTAFLLLGWGFITKHTQEFSRLALFTWAVVSPAMMICFRLGIRLLQRILRMLGYNSRSFAIVGVTELGFQLARNIERLPEMGLKFVGFYDDRTDERTPDVPEDIGRRIGNLDDLLARARAGEVNIIYITFPMRDEDRIRGVLSRLSDSTASVYVVPDFFVFQLLHSRWSDILGLPVVSVFETPFYGIDGMVKRFCDLVLGSLLLFLLSIPMIIIALWIKFTSPGPVFFRQRRYGLDGREIRVWKFRTMTVCEDGAQAVQATRNDPRVTAAGALLRRTSLDELPQLFNVVEGSMSLIGPRPHPNALNEQFRRKVEGYMLRHKVKPGITGLAQVSGWRGETDTPEKMEKRIEFDLRYIRDWSLWMDIKILLRTVWVVVSGQNAY
jgi:putative colanic acid biosysnthesis UDP-glucose lipid carrier transferase